MQLLLKPIGDVFFELASKANESILLVAPFATYPVLSKLCETTSLDDLQIITSLSLASVSYGSLSADGLGLCLNHNARLFNVAGLHAKEYLFDSTHAIVTSANLTGPGLAKNEEAGVLLTEPDKVAELRLHYSNLIEQETTGSILPAHLLEMKALSKQMAGLSSRITRKEASSPEIDILTTQDLEAIKGDLSSWMRGLIDVISQYQAASFSRKELMEGPSWESIKALASPGAKTPEQTMSRVLQQLRDIGLLQFTARGEYVRLW